MKNILIPQNTTIKLKMQINFLCNHEHRSVFDPPEPSNTHGILPNTLLSARVESWNILHFHSLIFHFPCLLSEDSSGL